MEINLGEIELVHMLTACQFLCCISILHEMLLPIKTFLSIWEKYFSGHSPLSNSGLFMPKALIHMGPFAQTGGHIE